jgi:sialate O-acetylesterase
MRSADRGFRNFIGAIGVILVLALARPEVAFARESLAIAPIFTDFAVIQRDRPVAVWGRGQPGARIEAGLGGGTADTVVDRRGNWRLDLAALPAREDIDLVVGSSTGERIALHHLTAGDVWLCAGQSNMEFPLRSASNAETELAQSGDDLLRLLLVPRQRSHVEATDFSQAVRWQPSEPQSATDFSAACYFMGRELRRKSHVPIGLISMAWGGSRIEDWLSAARLGKVGGFAAELALLDRYAANPAAADAAAATRLTLWMATLADRPRPDRVPVAGNPERGRWEEWGEASLADFDGLARYRATVTLTLQQARNARFLSIGQVDDIDLTRLNGVTAGSSVGWDKARRYALTGLQVKAGSNQVDVIVLDTGSGGGLWGSDPRGVVLEDETLIPFDRTWTLQPLASLAETGLPPLAPWLNGEGLATLHNGMIAPLGNYGVTGFAWYQGESNADRAASYARLLRALIDDWRLRFGGRRFMLVQLANFGPMKNGPAPSNWAALREAQREVAQGDAATLLVPAIDVGDIYDIHPTNKREVGRRLALAASSDQWNLGGIAQKISGNALLLDFGRSYRLVGGVAEPTGIEACDPAGRCRFVDSRLDAPGRLRIEVAPADVEVRYLWADSPLVSLFDSDGIPLPPFKLRITR